MIEPNDPKLPDESPDLTLSLFPEPLSDSTDPSDQDAPTPRLLVTESPTCAPQQEAQPTASSELSAEERATILRLHDVNRQGTRRIAAAIGRSRRAVQGVLREEGRLTARSPRPKPSLPATAAEKASKLDPFREEIKDRVAKGLTNTRILREIRELGYEGGLTVLGDYTRQLRAPLAPRKKVTRRFELPAGVEAQADWSTYRVTIGGVLTVIQVLAVVLACSRKVFVWATDNQKLPRLLEGLALAFEHFQGCALRVLFDNMAVVTLGRVGPDRKPIWNPGFLPFVQHYGFDPAVCRIADPDRKGEVEAVLGYFERDCLRGLEPESLADLNRMIRRWTDEIANKRVHGTTGRVPDEAWEEERPFLIPLPERRYPGACFEETRRVAEDCTISVLGTTYTVPARLAHRQVRVRLYNEHFEVLDRDSSIAFSRLYALPRQKGTLVLDPDHYKDLPRARPDRRRGVGRQLEEQLLARWPGLEGFLAGLKLRVKSLAHVHLRRLLALADRYGADALQQAAEQAHEANLHTAQAVERILERHFVELDELDPIVPLGAEARVNTALGEVESGSLGDYAHLDEVDGSEGPSSTDEDQDGSGVPRGA